MSNTTVSPSHHDTVQTILAQAQLLFAERGFDGVSVSDVAKAARVSKANIFHHFGNKQALYMEVLKSSLSEHDELTEHLQPERAPIEQRLQHFLEAHAAHLQQHPQSARLVLRELLEDRSEVTQQLAEQTTDAQFRQLLSLLQEGQQAGEIRDDVNLAALMIVMIGAVIFPFQVRSLLRHQPEAGFTHNPEQYSRLLADILLHGISAKETDK
jgi:TetR/AcrR family transcriptional regulator